LPLFAVARYVEEHRDPTVPREHRGSSSALLAGAQNAESSGSAMPGRPRVLPFVGLGFLMASTAEMLNSLFPVLATEYAGLSSAQAGVIYAVSTLGIIFSGPIFGWLSDTVSRRLVLAVRAVANTGSSILYLLFPTFAGIAVAKAADDMGRAAFRPAWGSLMAEVSSFDRGKRWALTRTPRPASRRHPICATDCTSPTMIRIGAAGIGPRRVMSAMPAKRKTLTSMDEIARLARVAKSTVSRAFQDSPLLNP